MKPMRIWRRVEQAIRELYESPKLLKGSGIQTEDSFERHLHRHGIFLSRKVGYERYPNGKNFWPDFHVYDDRTILPIEIKSTRHKMIHLSQTWIQSHAIYIIRCIQPTSVFISYGKDMKTEEEDRQFKEFQFAHRTFKEEWSKSKTFTSQIHWTSSMDLRYRLDDTQKANHYQRVLEELRRM
jgi:hypothetical protein